MLDVSVGRASAHLVPGALLLILVGGAYSMLHGAAPSLSDLGLASTFILIAVSYVLGQVLGIPGYFLDRYRWRRGIMWQARNLDDGFPLPPETQDRLEALFRVRFSHAVPHATPRSPEAQLTLFKVVEDYVRMRGSSHGASARNQFAVFRGVTVALAVGAVVNANIILYRFVLQQSPYEVLMLALLLLAFAPSILFAICVDVASHFERQHVLAVYEGLLAVEAVAEAKRPVTPPQATP